MQEVMICLVGEQPVPNLLPIRHCKPSTAVLVHSEQTKRVSHNLERLVQREASVMLWEVPPYDILGAQEKLSRYVSEQQWSSALLIFNLTGGTKMMALAAFLLAQKYRSPFVYLQSEGRQNRLHRYRWEGKRLVRLEPAVLQESLTIDDYLRAHVGEYSYRKRKPDPYEQLISEALRPHVDELVANVAIDPNIEIDLVVRQGNQVGVVEVTAGKADKEKIDQLHSVTGREVLGTYTRRFLITRQALEMNNRSLAQGYGITIIEELGDLSDGPKRRLIQMVIKELGG